MAQCRCRWQTVVNMETKYIGVSFQGWLSQTQQSQLSAYICARINYSVNKNLKWQYRYFVMGLTHEFVTNSIERSPWWKANSSSGSQDIPKILWTQNVHCRVHKSQLRVRIMNQLNPGQYTHTDLYKIQFSINLPSKPTSSKVSISCRRTHQNLFSCPVLAHSLGILHFILRTYFSVRS